MQSQPMKLSWKLKLIRQLLVFHRQVINQYFSLLSSFHYFLAHGIIEEIYVADGDTVKAGQQLYKLKITGEAPAAKAEAPKAAAAPPPPPPKAEPPKAAAVRVTN